MRISDALTVVVALAAAGPVLSSEVPRESQSGATRRKNTQFRHKYDACTKPGAGCTCFTRDAHVFAGACQGRVIVEAVGPAPPLLCTPL